MYEEGLGLCPRCGRFCKNIIGYINEIKGLYKVEAECKKCGIVDLTEQGWGYDDFYAEET